MSGEYPKRRLRNWKNALKAGSAQAAAGICKRVSANPDPRGARSFPLFVGLPRTCACLGARARSARVAERRQPHRQLKAADLYQDKRTSYTHLKISNILTSN